jgi:hypothetical protein
VGHCVRWAALMTLFGDEWSVALCVCLWHLVAEMRLVIGTAPPGPFFFPNGRRLLKSVCSLKNLEKRRNFMRNGYGRSEKNSCSRRSDMEKDEIRNLETSKKVAVIKHSEPVI